ncbi:DgyrCDS3912 [Dimorphilus gyrociliatus]|uniref:DgyrCDS3912 n=1 Tax=Dimorphilus gyrociliatus TaxID=2664684 RepID=A0A7I8VHY5_9ANNE|nr:DgyrCDS3912 [Dimorphilus gyrociliatus]
MLRFVVDFSFSFTFQLSLFQECVNELGDDSYCDFLANLGECVAQREAMIRFCRKSCLRCSKVRIPCENTFEDPLKCDYYAKRGDCLSNPAWMLPFCRKSCLKCNGKRNEYRLENFYKKAYNNEYETSVNDTLEANRIGCDYWAKNGFCRLKKLWMLFYCRKSCSKFDPVLETICMDSYKAVKGASCKNLAEDGDCINNRQWMLENCYASCTGCNLKYPRECLNEHLSDEECDVWANEGDCERNPHWMSRNCFKSCSRCEYSTLRKKVNCSDRYDAEKCQLWSSNGYCLRNFEFMLPLCKKSCGWCDYQLNTLNNGIVGNSMQPGFDRNNFAGKSVIFGQKFSLNGSVYSFAVYFAKIGFTFIEIWRPIGDSFKQIYQLSVENSLNSSYAHVFVPADKCIEVKQNDRFGLTSISNQDIPVLSLNHSKYDSFWRDNYSNKNFIKMDNEIDFIVSANFKPINCQIN